MKNNKNYFGIVRWCEEDIANAIETQGYEPTEENIAKIRNMLNHHSFIDCMVEAGWDFIYNTVNGGLNNENL